MSPPWPKPCPDDRVGIGDGCQGARGDPASGHIGSRRSTLINLHGQGEGREGRQPSYAIAVGRRPVQSLSTEETSSKQFFFVV